MNFGSTWNNLLKQCIYAQGALRKKLHIAPFVDRFKTATLEKSH